MHAKFGEDSLITFRVIKVDGTDRRTDRLYRRTDGITHPSHNTLRSASALLNAGERIKTQVGFCMNNPNIKES